jgi:hypothetical protein
VPSSTPNLNFKSLSPYLIGGALSALLFSFFSRVLGDLGGTLAQLPLLILALLMPRVVPSALGLSALGAGALVLLDLGAQSTLSYCVYVALPSLLFSWLALQHHPTEKKIYWYPLERLMGAVVVYALVLCAFFAVAWLGFDLQEKFFKALEGEWAKFSVTMQEHIELVRGYVKALWPYVPGLSTGFLIWMTTLNTSVTQRWFKKRGLKFPRPALLLSELYLPWGAWTTLAVLGLGWALLIQFDPLLGQAVGNLAIPLIFVFILQGLAIINTFAKMQKKPHLILVIFYGCVVVLGWVLLIVFLMGLLEPWLNLRERLKSVPKD